MDQLEVLPISSRVVCLNAPHLKSLCVFEALSRTLGCYYNHHRLQVVSCETRVRLPAPRIVRIRGHATHAHTPGETPTLHTPIQMGTYLVFHLSSWTNVKSCHLVLNGIEPVPRSAVPPRVFLQRLSHPNAKPQPDDSSDANSKAASHSKSSPPQPSTTPHQPSTTHPQPSTTPLPDSCTRSDPLPFQCPPYPTAPPSYTDLSPPRYPTTPPPSCPEPSLPSCPEPSLSSCPEPSPPSPPHTSTVPSPTAKDESLLNGNDFQRLALGPRASKPSKPPPVPPKPKISSKSYSLNINHSPHNIEDPSMSKDTRVPPHNPSPHNLSEGPQIAVNMGLTEDVTTLIDDEDDWASDTSDDLHKVVRKRLSIDMTSLVDPLPHNEVLVLLLKPAEETQAWQFLSACMQVTQCGGKALVVDGMGSMKKTLTRTKPLYFSKNGNVQRI